MLPPGDAVALGPLVRVGCIGPVAGDGGAGLTAIAVAETTAVAATTVRLSSMVIVCPSAW